MISFMFVLGVDVFVIWEVEMGLIDLFYEVLNICCEVGIVKVYVCIGWFCLVCYI